MTERNKALCLYNDHYCLKRKTDGGGFKTAIGVLKSNFIKVDNYLTNENVKSYSKYEKNPKEMEKELFISIVYELETYNTNRARPYCASQYSTIETRNGDRT